MERAFNAAQASRDPEAAATWILGIVMMQLVNTGNRAIDSDAFPVIIDIPFFPSPAPGQRIQ